MKRFTNFHSLNVFSLHLEDWEYEWHLHNFYEIIFIEEGTGLHLLNDLSMTYEPGDVFLLTPEDAHAFEIKTKTLFSFIKFTEQVFVELLANSSPRELGNNSVASIFQARNQIGSFIKDTEDKKHLFHLLKVIQHEFKNSATYQHEITWNVFKSILLYLLRHAVDLPKLASNKSDLLQSMLTYMRLHAIDNEKMNIKAMATTFNLSKNYISSYIKKHTGLTLHHYVIQIKLNQAEHLLLQNNSTIGEIASRLGFNDSSHFNKIFKKYKGVSPTSYRQ